MSHLHETVAEMVSAAMIEPVLSFIPHQGELACQHGLHRDDALASFEEELCVRTY